MTAEVVSDSVPGRPATSLGYRANGRVIDHIGPQSRPHPHEVADTEGLPSSGPCGGVTDAPAPLSLSIIMAAFNEERTVLQAVREVLACDFPCETELIVVDDGSTDRTFELLSSVLDPRVVVHRHDGNRGKGAALMSGAAIAKGTYVVPFDADLEYVAADVVRLLDPVLRGRTQVVYGVRLSGYNTVYQTYRYAIGNKTLTRLTNILYDACLTDLHTCLKLIPTALLKKVNFKERGFGLDTEMTATLLRNGVRPFEVPVTYYGRSHAEGKKITWRDAVACAWILVCVRLRRRPTGLEEHLSASVIRDGPVHNRAVTSNINPAIGESGEEYVPVAG